MITCDKCGLAFLDPIKDDVCPRCGYEQPELKMGEANNRLEINVSEDSKEKLLKDIISTMKKYCDKCDERWFHPCLSCGSYEYMQRAYKLKIL